MSARELLVDQAGYTLTDTDGYEIDQTCLSACCGPGGDCPTPCGRAWMVCVRKWRSLRTLREVITHPALGLVRDLTVYHEVGMRPQDNGLDGPWRLSPVDPGADGIDGDCQFVAAGLVPMRDVYEQTTSLRPIGLPADCAERFEPWRDEVRGCAEFTGYCTSPESEGNNPAPGLPPFLAVPGSAVLPVNGPTLPGWVTFAPIDTRTGGGGAGQGGAGTCNAPTSVPWGSFAYDLTCLHGNIPTPCTSRVTLFNQLAWRFARSGLSFYRRVFTQTQTGQVGVSCPGSFPSSPPTFFGCGTITRQERVEIELEWTHSTTEDNEGQTFPACDGHVPSECVGARTWVEGRSCGRTGRGRVFLPFENVRACGLAAVGEPDALGRRPCYTFDKRFGLTASLPAGALVGNNVVDQTSPRTCCACGAAQGLCAATDLAAQAAGGGRPNWVRARRNAGGVLEVTPAFVAGACCCSPADLITVNFVESELTAFGASLLYRLRPGRGLQATFRRDQRWPVGDPADGGGDPSAGQFVSDVYELLPGGGAGAIVGQQFWGQALNEPPMACEWTQMLGGGYFDFNRPHEGAGTWNNSLGPTAGRLAAPGDADRDDFVNGFRLMEWTVGAVTCELFDFEGRWAHVNGGGLVNRLRVTIARPETPGDPCGGGCAPPPDGVGGSGAAAALSAGSIAGGCAHCG